MCHGVRFAHMAKIRKIVLELILIHQEKHLDALNAMQKKLSSWQAIFSEKNPEKKLPKRAFYKKSPNWEVFID